MKYRLSISDTVKDKMMVFEIEAPSVFDAIDIVAKQLSDAENTELVEAVPIG